MRLKCSECCSIQVKLFKVRFKNESWHVKAVCSDCDRQRYVNKDLFFKEDLPVMKTQKEEKYAHLQDELFF